MKQLLLVRHAESNLNYNNLKDFDRPLNNKGEKDAKIMAKQLIDLKFIPEYIISSGANRALTTSKIIAQNVNYPESDIEVNDNIYHSSYETVLEIVQNISDEYKKIMIVGHNPTFHFLSQILSGENVSKFPTCSMFCIEFDVEHWAQIDKGKKQFMIFPKLFEWIE